MPGTPTPNYGWPIPAANDPADAPVQINALGVASDATVKGIDTRVAANEAGIIDARIIVATSTTRPTPVAGKLLFETDTNRLMMGIVVATVGYWVPMPGTHVFTVRQTAAQSIPDGVYTPINFQAVDYDPFGFWVAGSPTQFKPKFPGRYEMTGGCGYQSNSTNYRGTIWYKNNLAALGGIANQTGTVGIGTLNVARPYPVPMNGTTDYVELLGIQTSGVALNTSSATSQYQATMNAVYLGP